jgi:hypothetical protein
LVSYYGTYYESSSFTWYINYGLYGC